MDKVDLIKVSLPAFDRHLAFQDADFPLIFFDICLTSLDWLKVFYLLGETLDIVLGQGSHSL